MKALLLYLILQNSTFALFAQLDSAGKAFIYDILKREPGSDSIIYTDKIDPGLLKYSIKEFKKQKLSGYNPITLKQAKIILSSKDKRQLSEYLKTIKNTTWQEQLFFNSKRISVDSTWQYISNCSRKIITRSQHNGEKIDISHEIVAHCSLFQFSKPLFLQNREIAIFYFVRLCGGLCGVEDFSVYKLENGAYKKWLLIAGGVF